MNQKSLDKLSLCQNGCYCMTKTIKGLCGKCGEMKSLDKKKTSEIFEGVGSSLHQAFIGAVERDNNKPKELEWHIKWDYLLNKKKWKNPDEVNKVLTKFVEDLLTQQRTELLEEIPKKIKGKNKEFVEGYNNAIDDITKLLNKKNE